MNIITAVPQDAEDIASPGHVPDTRGKSQGATGARPKQKPTPGHVPDKRGKTEGATGARLKQKPKDVPGSRPVQKGQGTSGVMRTITVLELIYSPLEIKEGA